MIDQLVALEVTGIQQTDPYNVEINLRAQQEQQAVLQPEQSVNKVEESDEKKETPTSEEKQYSTPQRTTKDVTLRFKIDKDSHDVQVILVDKESGEVIRTIPPDELKLLQEGELVEVYA